MKTIIDTLFYREGDNGAVAGGLGIPPAPTVTGDAAPTVIGETSALGIPPAPTVTADVDDNDDLDADRFSVDKAGRTTLDDIPYADDEDEREWRARQEASTTEAAAKGDEAPVEVKPPADAPPVEAAVPISEAVVNVLKAAADALGITETDPAKLSEAIEARTKEITAEQQRQREAADLSFEQKAVEGLQEKARVDVIQLMNPAIKERLRGEEYPIDTAPEDWWNTESPNFDAQMASRYNQIFSELRVQPQYEKAFVDAYTGYKAAYDGEKARVAEFATKYPNHSAELVSDLRRAGVTADGQERIARMTHEQVTRAIATTHSSIAAKDAELTQLRAQVSGHADAIAKAKAEGIAEERTRLAKELGRGQRETPGTIGVGGTTTAPINDWNTPISWEDIPYADSRIN